MSDQDGREGGPGQFERPFACRWWAQVLPWHLDRRVAGSVRRAATEDTSAADARAKTQRSGGAACRVNVSGSKAR